MKITLLIGFLITAILEGCVSQTVKTEPLVLSKVVYSTNAAIPQAVRSECDLPNKLSTFIRTAAEDVYTPILTDSAPAPAQANILNVEITHVEGASGGAWTGAKSVAIKATLTKQGQVLGDFKAARISNSAALVTGLLGGLEGTCSLLKRCIRTLGTDVAEWLKHPTPNAVLK